MNLRDPKNAALAISIGVAVGVAVWAFRAILNVS